MTTFYMAIEGGLAIISQRNGNWNVDFHQIGNAYCLAVDPPAPELVYCGTFDRGLWRSKDAGHSWEPVGTGITQTQMTAVAVSKTERTGSAGVVYAGTEPSYLFRSEDGGTTWEELAALRELPSAPTWSFPPRPYTSHVRWITPDPLVAGRLFVAIEAGALVRSFDGGKTWEDRKPDGPYDTHTLVMHPQAPDRLYSAAGDGFMRAGNGFVQSDNGGESWYRPDTGIEHHYLWSVAADPANPDTVLISAARGPQEAHNPIQAESVLYRRSGSSDWQRVQYGLPDAQGTLTSVLATLDAEPGVFYAANNKGLFRSSDAGINWEAIPVQMPANQRWGRVHALVVVQE